MLKATDTASSSSPRSKHILKATDTVKNIKHLQEITKKIIDNYHNDDVQLYTKNFPSLNEDLQQMNELMDTLKNTVEKIEQGAIRWKLFYKNDTRITPQEILDTLHDCNQNITKAIDHLQKNSPDTLDKN